MLRSLLAILVLLFPLSEVALAVSRHTRGARSASIDRGSLRLMWVVIVLSVTGATAFSNYAPLVIHAPHGLVDAVALVLLSGGLALRWMSILYLGRYFTVNVAVMHDHRVVDSGPYRYVRHPSYSGLLVAFAGLGLYFNNWLSLLVVILPVTIALVYRIRVEEAALVSAMGSEYVAYCARTKRLVPGIL